MHRLDHQLTTSVMAQVVYTSTSAGDGAAAPPEPQGMFSGMTFFISMHVPSRSYFQQLIKANGGRLSDMDKSADFIIIDHKRNAVYTKPVYSFQFLEDCIKNGRLEDIDNYEIGRYRKAGKTSTIGKPKATGNAMGAEANQGPSSPPGLGKKIGRNYFTEEDDEILLNWISRPGVTHISGFEIYKALERKYPNHTFHAWRDRWCKNLSKKMPEGPKPRRIVKFDDDPEHPDQGVEFTREDDQILLQMKDEIITAPDEEQIYKSIERKYPQHNSARWKHRFNDVVLPIVNKKSVEQPPVNEGLREDLSPRSSDEPPELKEDAEVPEVEVANVEKAHQGPSEAPAKGLEESHERRASDQGVASAMGQLQSSTTEANANGSRKSHALDTAVKQDRPLPAAAEDNCILPPQRSDNLPSTPAHHGTSLSKPPPSPKGHPTRELTISPTRSDNRAISPAQNHRVHKWVAEVSQNTPDDDESSVDQQIETQIKNEIDDNSPTLPTNSLLLPESPSSALERVVENKRKRGGTEFEEGNQHAPPMHPIKRTKLAASAISSEISPTPEPQVQSGLSNTQYPSTPPPKQIGMKQHLRKLSPPLSDSNSLRPAAPMSSRAPSSIYTVQRSSEHEPSTQALYDKIPDLEDEPLENESISGLEDDDSSDDFDIAPGPFPDEEVFNTTSRGKGKGAKVKETAAIFDKRNNEFNFDEEEVVEDDSEDEDPEEAEAEIANYLVEKSKEYSLPEKDVIEAVERTSGEKVLVDVVLKSLKDGKGIPTNIAGIWSPEEDEIILSSDAKAIARVEKKHGTVLDRIDWLEKYRAA